MGLFSKVFKIFKAVAPIAAAFIPGAQPLAGLGTFGQVLSGASSILGAVQGLQAGKQNKGQAAVAQPAQAETFNPTRPDAMQRPNSLQDLAGYAPDQERTALATKGLNQGLGADENSYYRNLVQRTLIGDGNNVAPSLDSLLPVEQQYFGQQGVPTSNVTNFLRAIRG